MSLLWFSSLCPSGSGGAGAYPGCTCVGAPRWVARSLWFWCWGCTAREVLGWWGENTVHVLSVLGLELGTLDFPSQWPNWATSAHHPLLLSCLVLLYKVSALFSSTRLCYSLSHGHSIHVDTGERFSFMMQNESSVYRTNCLDDVCLWLHELVAAQGLRQLWGRSYHWEKWGVINKSIASHPGSTTELSEQETTFSVAAKKSHQREIIQTLVPSDGRDADGGILAVAERRVAKRAPLWVGGNLPRPPLILRPATPAAFSIEEKVSFISYNLLWSLRLFIDFFFYVYLWTQHIGGRRKGPKKQTNTREHRSPRCV